MLSEVKVYKLNKKTNKLEHHKTISKENVKLIYDEKLKTSQSYYNTSPAEYKSSGKKTHPNYKSKPNYKGRTSPDKYTPGAMKQVCAMCKSAYYATNKRNTKFCSQKCGRNMSNEYKKGRDRVKRNKS